MNGNNIIIRDSAGTLIAATKSNEWQTEAETIEVSSPTQGAWRSYIAGRKEWSVTTSFLVGDASKITKCLNIGTSYTLNFCENTTNYPVKLTGTAILKICKITATKGNLCTGSFQFVGNGELDEPSINGGGGGGME